MSNGKTFDVVDVGIFSPKPISRDYLMVGDVGYITASIKTIQDTRVGDTVTLANNPASEPLSGYRKNEVQWCTVVCIQLILLNIMIYVMH